MKPIYSLLLIAAFIAFVGGWFVYYRNGGLHTWIDDVEPVVIHRIAAENHVTPPEFVNSDSTARLVDDRVTGEQVLVVNTGWRANGRITYRILRRVKVKVIGLNKSGFFWSVETRTLDELQPIPSI